MRRRNVSKKYPHAAKGPRLFKSLMDVSRHLWGNLPKWKAERSAEALMVAGYVKVSYIIFDHSDESNDQAAFRLTVAKGSPQAAAALSIGSKSSHKLTKDYVRRKFADHLAVPPDRRP